MRGSHLLLVEVLVDLVPRRVRHRIRAVGNSIVPRRYLMTRMLVELGKAK